MMRKMLRRSGKDDFSGIPGLCSCSPRNLLVEGVTVSDRWKGATERSFAQGTYFGMKKARWRRLWRVQILEYLIATAQNIPILMKATKDRFTGILKKTGSLCPPHRFAHRWDARSLFTLITALRSAGRLPLATTLA
jgi:hypothetical protein